MYEQRREERLAWLASRQTRSTQIKMEWWVEHKWWVEWKWWNIDWKEAWAFKSYIRSSDITDWKGAWASQLRGSNRSSGTQNTQKWSGNNRPSARSGPNVISEDARVWKWTEQQHSVPQVQAQDSSFHWKTRGDQEY